MAHSFLFDFILLVDDDHATNYFHDIIIKESGFVKEVKYVMSGQSALDFYHTIEKQENQKTPDLVLLDINMPVLNGWDFLEKLEEKNLPTNPNIAMLTTSINPLDRQRAIEHPLVFDFLIKPLEAKHIVQLHEKLR